MLFFRNMQKLILYFLNRVEKVGNRLPDPVTLFFLCAVGVLIFSWAFSMMNLSAIHPSDSRVIEVKNLLSLEGIQMILTKAVSNFTAFPPLGLVLVTMLGVGVAERSGYIQTGLKSLVTSVPKSLLTATLVFGGIMSSMVADAGYVVLTPLGAVLFASVGRHPLAGLAAAFAGVSGGFSANLMITSLDPLLSGLSTAAAQLNDPNYVVQPTANYYFMIASVFLLTFVGTWVTTKIVEPRLGEWKPNADYEAGSDLGQVSNSEKKGMWLANLSLLAGVILIIALLIPEHSIFKSAEHGLKPFFESLVFQIMILFLIAGIVFGIAAKTIRSDKDVARMMSDSMASMGSYIVLAFFAAQFVAYFNWSNLGLIVAIKGAAGLHAIGFQGIPLLLSFIIVAGLINIFIGSASAKWAIMAPVFVPMLMLMGISPEMSQLAYRLGDSITNVCTPLLPYFPIIIAFAQRYDKNVGIGTLLATMIPYAIAFAIAWTLMMIVWILFNWPLGPGAMIYYGG